MTPGFPTRYWKASATTWRRYERRVSTFPDPCRRPRLTGPVTTNSPVGAEYSPEAACSASVGSAKRRFAAATSPLSEADVGWYKRTLAADYRIILNHRIRALRRGQDMNTGIQDAMALVDPLITAIRSGRSDPIDEWVKNRKRIAQDVVQLTNRITWAATLSSPTARAVRNVVMRLLGRIPRVRHAIARQLAELDNT